MQIKNLDSVRKAPKGKIYKTFTTEVVSDVEAKELFKNSKQIVECNLKGLPVDEERTMVLKISTSNPDRSNDVVYPDGAVLDNYKNNNVVAGFHNYNKPAVGRGISVGIGNDYIVSKMEFTPDGANPDADVLHDLYKGGFQHAASIGFMPLKDGYEPNDQGGYNFTKWELFEYSLVLVPDNPEALTIMRSKGFDPDKIIANQKAFEEKPQEPTEEGVQPEEKSKKEETKETPKEEKKEEVKVTEKVETKKKKKQKPSEKVKKLEAKIEAMKKELEAKDADDNEGEADDPSDDTPITELTVGDLKDILEDAFEDAEAGEDQAKNEGKVTQNEDGKTVSVEAIKKDVNQVVALGYLLDELSYFIWYFTETEVSQPSIDKLNQALSLVMDVVKEQATLGQKEISLPVMKDGKLVIEKEGRSISADNEKMLKSAQDHANQIHGTIEQVLNGNTPTEQVSEESDEMDGMMPMNDADKSVEDELYSVIATPIEKEVENEDVYDYII